jgi:SAM-dependent methyltransferase
VSAAPGHAIKDIMNPDPFAEMKLQQREMWSSFAASAIFTTAVAGHLVKFANVQAGEVVLDIGTGTGVVAITAARAGAQVSGLDLTPDLLEVARENSTIARQTKIVWAEGDAEHLPYSKSTFDVVLSQFGHMFAPQPDIVIAEMRRVLKPNGRIAFATWPPEHFVGRMFSYVGRNSPPPPPGAHPPPEWGNPAIIAERLRTHFGAPLFERGIMSIPALSLEHFRGVIERTVGPVQKLVESLCANPKKLERFRSEFEALAAPYYSSNVMRQDYLLTRANALAAE